jgi:hypothetical protein
MPTYFFHIVQIDGTYVEDTVGQELPDAKAAQEEAKRCLAEMASDAINEDLSELRIDVKDAGGNRIALRSAHFDHDDAD